MCGIGLCAREYARGMIGMVLTGCARDYDTVHGKRSDNEKLAIFFLFKR